MLPQKLMGFCEGCNRCLPLQERILPKSGKVKWLCADCARNVPIVKTLYSPKSYNQIVLAKVNRQFPKSSRFRTPS